MAGGLRAAAAQPAAAPAPSPARGPFGMKTYTYKQVGDLKLEADVYRAEDAQPRPVLAYLHGGALIMGNRRGVFPDLKGFCQAQGYCLVSAEYRLAPETKLPQIIEDLRDFIRWISADGPGLFHADASKVVVAGQSAGGYLTMMAGLCEPRPKALVSYWGYGDVDGPWYTQPSEFYRKTVPLITKAKAYQGIGLDGSGTPLANPPARQDRGQFYHYLRQNGLWTREVSGFDPATEPRRLDPYCPVRNLTAGYPPILMIHGTADTDVPCQESQDMADALKKVGVKHELITVAGAGHVLANGDKQLVAQAYARAQQFIQENLGTPSAPVRPAGSATQPASGPEVYQAWPFDAKEAVRRQEATAKALGVDKEITLNLADKVPMKFMLIPAGRFMMGSPGAQHEVTIAKPYYLAVYKVTQAQYAQVTGNNPSSAKGKDFPVHNVTWRDAVEFCQKASQITHKSIHLPTEAQWEHACRAGANTRFFWGDDESQLGDYCWYRENLGGVLHAVGLKKPNVWGLYDINGLMWEPCRTRPADPNAGPGDTAKDYALCGATFGSRPPMFVLGVTIPPIEDRAEGKGLDRCGMRVAMDAE